MMKTWNKGRTDGNKGRTDDIKLREKNIIKSKQKYKNLRCNVQLFG